MLKKEFKRKDVQRARNLIQGKTGASTGIQIGYNKKQEDYKEGDVWTEGRKTWTIKCYDCVIDFEGKLRVRGEYEDYIKNLKGKNNLEILKELEFTLLDAVNISNEGFVSEDGVIERWVGGINKEKFTKEIKKAVKSKRKHIKKELSD